MFFVMCYIMLYMHMQTNNVNDTINPPYNLLVLPYGRRVFFAFSFVMHINKINKYELLLKFLKS